MVGVVRLPNVPMSKGTRPVSPISNWTERRRHAQFLGHSLRQRRANVLPHFHLARADRDFAAFIDVQPGGKVLGKGFVEAAASAAGFLRVKESIEQAENHDAAAQNLEEITPRQGEAVGGRRGNSYRSGSRGIAVNRFS